MPGTSRAGLGLWRSDDEGQSWTFHRVLLPSTDHMVADAVPAGDDVAAVYSFDTTSTTFPQPSWRESAWQWRVRLAASLWRARRPRSPEVQGALSPRE